MDITVGACIKLAHLCLTLLVDLVMVNNHEIIKKNLVNVSSDPPQLGC